MAEKKSKAPAAHMPIADERTMTIDDKMANSYIDLMNPAAQEKLRHQSYTWHHESLDPTYKYVNGLLKDSKDHKKTIQENAFNILGEYMLQYLERKLPSFGFKKWFEARKDKKPEEKFSDIMQFADAFLGIDQKVLQKTFLPAFHDVSTADELRNNLHEAGRDYFWKSSGLVNDELGKRYELAFAKKSPKALKDFITKHKMFGGYEILKKHETQFEDVFHHNPKGIIDTIAANYHTTPVGEKELADIYHIAPKKMKQAA